MRIAIFIKRTTFHKGFGGLETQNKLLCEGLAERGHDVTVFSPKLEIETRRKTENGVDYVFVPCVFRSLFAGIIKDHWYNRSYEAYALYKLSQPFDLIISQSSAGIGILKHKKDIDVPFVSISHGSASMELKTVLENIYTFKDFLKALFQVPYMVFNILFKQRFFIHNSDKIIAVSNYVAKTLSIETQSPKDKFYVVQNGIKPIVNSSLLNPSSTNLLYLGQIQRSKGLDYLIQLVQDPLFKDVHIDVVGGGDYLEEFKAKLTKLGINSFFTVHGKVDYDKALFFYSNASVFLFPTKRYEGLPMVLVEAMFNELPIVAFNKGGVADVIDEGETGYLVKSGNLKKFKKNLLKLMQNHELCESMRVKSLEKAEKDFTIEHMLDEYEQVFEGISK